MKKFSPGIALAALLVALPAAAQLHKGAARASASKAEELGYLPEVILAGRRINNNIGRFIAQEAVKLLSAGAMPLRQARVGILGLTFKENVPDLRNSRIPDIVAELRQFGLAAQVHDPLGDPAEAQAEYGITLASLDELVDLDVLILAVSHQAYLDHPADLLRRVKDGGVVIDVKSALDPRTMERGLRYWSL